MLWGSGMVRNINVCFEYNTPTALTELLRRIPTIPWYTGNVSYDVIGILTRIIYICIHTILPNIYTQLEQ